MTQPVRPVLITDAQQPFEEQFAARKRRYAILMGARLLLVILAALSYALSPWLAVGLLALSIPLPWMAVLIANDAPARRSSDAHRLPAVSSVRAIMPRPADHDRAA